MLALLAAATLAASAGDIRAEPESGERSWLIWTGLAPGLRSGGAGGGVGYIGFSRSVTEHLRPELDLGLGYFGGPQQIVGSGRIGLNVDLSRGPIVPFGWIAFAHNHEMPLHMAQMSPLDMVLGMSESGVEHRSGAEAGGGVNVHLGGARDAKLEAVAGVRLAATALLGSGPTWSGDLVAMLGVAF